MVTQEDIAKRLNISRASVSRALNSGTIKDNKRNEILEVAAEMGYRKNNAATSLASKKNIVVQAFLITSVVKGYYQQMKKGILDAEEMRKGYQFDIEIQYTDINKSKYLAKEQLKQFFDVLNEKKTDGVIASPLSQSNLNTMEKECNNRNIPFMTLDMPYENLNTCHVGTNYIEIGKITAALIANLIGKKGNVLVLASDEGYELNNSRINGFEQKMKSYNSIITLTDTLSEISYITYKKTIENYINKYKLNAIYATFRAEYVARVLKELGISRDIVVVANDLNKEIHQYLQEDLIQAIVYQRPYYQGFFATDNFFKYFFQNDKYNKNSINTGSDILIKENMSLENHPF